MRKFAMLVATLFLFAFAVTGCAQSIGSKAPEISAGAWFNANGPVSLAAFKDKLVVVEFWATWCPPCRASIPHLAKMYKEFKDKNVVIISMSNEPRGKIAAFIKRAKMTWIIGAESNTASAYGVQGIPHAFVIKDGKIVWSGHPMNGLDKAIEANLPKAEPESAKATAPVPPTCNSCTPGSCTAGSCTSGSCTNCGN